MCFSALGLKIEWPDLQYVVINQDTAQVFGPEQCLHTTQQLCTVIFGGGQIIVRDGKPADTAPFQPFGEKTHPRTAFGIARDGRIIATVVDGRRPDWSNGAALIELARIMINNGAVTAMNTDGGGSSTFIVRINDELRMLNHPADLYRPMEDLIRPLFDSLIFYEK